MRALIYLRNSSDGQAKAATIASQRPDCRELAARLGGGQVVEYPEEGVSGAASLDERPELRRLLRDVRQGDLVIAFALDRLSRSDDLIEQAAVYGALQRVGARVETVLDGAVDPSSMVGRIMLAVRSEVAAEERRKIVARTQAGKARAAATGRKPQGKTPFGLRYDRAGRTWAIDEPAAEVVREIYRRLLDGETCGRIAADLDARKAPAPRTVGWTARKVWHVATRATYRGEWTFDGRAIAVPPIVDGPTWQAAQAQLLAAGRRGLRRTTHVYLLDEGAGRCGYCGGELRVRWGGTGGTTSYYLCPRRDCGLGWHRAERVDGEVWRRIRDALRRPDLVERALGEGDAAAGDADLGDADAAGYERRLARLAEVESAILARFRRGLISEPALEREVGAIARERRLLEESAAAAREAARRARTRVASAQEVRAAAQAIVAALDVASPAERREVVHTVRPDVRLERDALRISLTLAAPPPATIAPGAAIGVVRSTCSCTENHCDHEKLQWIRVVA